MLSAWRRFGRWRHTRPFWGAALLAFAGVVIFWIPLAPVAIVVAAGTGAIAGMAIGAALVLLAAIALVAPSQRALAGLMGVLCAVAAFPLSNLGGFVIGSLAGVIGGGLVFAWAPARVARGAVRRPQGIAEGALGVDPS